MERLLVSRRQILKAGAAGVAGLAFRPMLALADDGSATDSMGPFSDWTTPVNIGSVVNSPYWDYHPAISKNGLSLYISSRRPGGFGGTAEIWVSQRASLDGPWGEPQNLGSAINVPGYNTAVPNFSPDGHWMFFQSGRPAGFGHDDLYVSHRTFTHDDFGWKAPVNLGPMINSAYEDDAPTYFVDEQTNRTTLYFASSRPSPMGPGTTGDAANFHIWAGSLGDDSMINDPVFVPELSSPYPETRTAIRRDGLEMFITSSRPGPIGGNHLWVSTRASSLEPWSAPVQLPSPINMVGAADGGPAISWDGTTMYFFSTRAGGGDRDLYKTTRTRLEG
jgi:hypothetical protein